MVTVLDREVFIIGIINMNGFKILLQSCEILIIMDNLAIRQYFSRKEEATIIEKGFVKYSDLPDQWYELSKLERLDGTSVLADKEQAFKYVKDIIPYYFVLTNGNPLVWQCSRNHARFYNIIFRKFRYKFSYIAGSLAGKKKIEDFNNLTGGSDDEQIVMLEKI